MLFCKCEPFLGPSLCLLPSHCPYYWYLLHPLLTFPLLLPFDCLATTSFYLTLLHSTNTFSHISASTITFLPNSPGAAASPPFQLLCPPPLNHPPPPPSFFHTSLHLNYHYLLIFLVVSVSFNIETFSATKHSNNFQDLNSTIHFP